MRSPLWKLEELTDRAARALSETGQEGESRRVRWMPDARTARFYTTLGLLDRPAELRGRTAYYGPRHLLQLVAIKRLQARGFSLDEVQRQLAGLSPESLAKLAHVPSEFLHGGKAPEPAVRQQPSRPGFWSQPAAPVRASSGAVAGQPRTLTALELAPGATLLLESTSRALTPSQVERLQEAAAPLLALLERLEDSKEPEDV